MPSSACFGHETKRWNLLMPKKPKIVTNDPLVAATKQRHIKRMKKQSREATKRNLPAKGLEYGTTREARRTLPAESCKHLPGRNSNINIRNITAAQKKAVAAEWVKDFNFSATAVRADIKRGTLWNLLHRDAEFMGIVRELSGAIAEEVGMDAKETLLEASRVARGNILDYFECDDDGDLKLTLASVTRGKMAAVRSIEYEECWQGRGEDRVLVRKPRITMHNKNEALKLVAQINKMLGDTLPGGAPGSMPPPAIIVKFTNDEVVKL